ncbi:unnamed protein product [Adineta steineri]|nr:unnamed protein product [Adineta steineri]
MIAGFGMVAVGLVLERVKELNVFKEITEIYILVPALLGLKGNLKMTLASRLSTQANIGNMDKKSELRSMIIGNIILTQLQAIVVGFLAALVSLAMGWVPQAHFNLWHPLVLCSSVLTASITSLALAVVAAMNISRVGGLILDFIVFQPVINGVGDNLAAIQASRLPTTLHQQDKSEEFQDITQYHASKFFPNPYKIFCSTSILILKSFINNTCFVISRLTTDQTRLSIVFISLYLIAALIQGELEGKASYLQTPCFANLRERHGLFLATRCIKLVAYSPVESNSIQYKYRTCSRDESNDNRITRTSHRSFIKPDWINLY